MRLTDNFTLDEFTRSQTAARFGIDNAPGKQQLINLVHTAATLEKIRSLFDAPIIVSSGFRCLELNRKIGSKDDSRHIEGLAVDFTVQGVVNEDAFNAIKDSNIEYQQLIYEFGRWIHLAIPQIGAEADNNALIAFKHLGQTAYRNAA